MKSLLVGLDREGRSRGALQVALHLGRADGAHLRAVHVIPIPMVASADLSLQRLAVSYDALEAGARQSLREAYGDALDQLTHLHVEPGHPSQVLLRVMEEQRPDLTIVGPHRRRPVIDLGDTARAILAKAEGPVWMQPGDFRPPTRILAPVDLSEGTPRVLEAAVTMARTFKATLKVVYYFNPPNLIRASGDSTQAPMEQVWRYERALFDKLVGDENATGVALEASFEEGPPDERILEAQQSCDLIVMGTHGRTGLWRMVLGNVAYGVLRQATVPVMVVPTPGNE